MLYKTSKLIHVFDGYPKGSNNMILNNFDPNVKEYNPPPTQSSITSFSHCFTPFNFNFSSNSSNSFDFVSTLFILCLFLLSSSSYANNVTVNSGDKMCIHILPYKNQTIDPPVRPIVEIETARNTLISFTQKYPESWISKLPTDALSEIAKFVKSRTLKKKYYMFQTGVNIDALYFLLEGRLIEQRVEPNEVAEKTRNIRYIEPGMIFGYESLSDNQSSSSNILVTEAATILYIPRLNLMPILAKYTDIYQSILGEQQKEIQYLKQLAEESLLEVYGRFRAFITREAKVSDQDHGERIVYGVTDQIIADFIGSSREMVTKIIKDLVVGEYIERDLHNHNLIIKGSLPKGW